MSWFVSIVIAILTATAGMFASGYVANLAVGWYRVSGFEGGAGYFVVLFALLGFVAGLVAGLVCSRLLAGSGDPGFFKALGSSLAVMLALVAVVGVPARLLADVPPEIDGERLMLAVQVRWPAAQRESPAATPGESFLTLGSVTRLSHVQRASTRGPLWKADAKVVDGRWVAPGAVDIFTNRGVRSLSVDLDDGTSKGFTIPLSGSPGKGDMKWSEWMPRARPGAPPLPDGFTYRYRVQRISEPVRTETFGPFEIATIAGGFFDTQVEGKSTVAAAAQFAIRHNGSPLVIGGRTPATGETGGRHDLAAEVAALPGPRPALLARVEPPDGNGQCYLLVDEAKTVRIDAIAECTSGFDAPELTSDAARFRERRKVEVARGRFDRRTFDRGGLFLFHHAVLDTRAQTVRHFEDTSSATPIPSVPPLGVSPDERSFARFVYADGSEASAAIEVVDVAASRTYLLPIDPARMRFAKLDALDPAWLTHHFAWQRGAEGADHLVERKGFVPIPFTGELSSAGDSSATYRLEPAGEPLRAALVDFLVSEFKAERIPVESGAYEQPLRIEGQVVNVAASTDFHYVSLSMAHGSTDARLVSAIARRFDAALATGKYDALFTK